MTELPEEQVEKAAEAAWRAWFGSAFAWPIGCSNPDGWRKVARAVLSLQYPSQPLDGELVDQMLGDVTHEESDELMRRYNPNDGIRMTINQAFNAILANRRAKLSRPKTPQTLEEVINGVFAASTPAGGLPAAITQAVEKWLSREQK